MDANSCACETSRSQLSHAQGFGSKSLTVASEYSFENVEILKFMKISPEFTATSCTKLKSQSDQSSSFRGTGVYRKVTNSCALESARPQLSNAQGFISTSRTIASDHPTENLLFSEIISRTGRIKQNPKATSLFFNIPKYFAALMKKLKKNQSSPKSSAK